MLPAWQIEGRTIAWPDNAEGHYHVPFVYSCNGRPYFKQLEQQSGIWHRDVRHPSNAARALPDFHSPSGLLDLLSPEKALIFCTNQRHAELVKIELDNAFKALYEEDYDQACVQIITGKTDKYEQKIKAFKNESKPKIAITVDLLTTDIDVPAICHLVFLRRVKSRILYEQMKGRATRRCDDIGKTVFKIYDPVDLYRALEPVDTMKPLVKDPNVTLEQLVHELIDPQSYQAPGANAGKQHADDVLDQLTRS